MDNFQISNNNSELPLNTTNTFIMEPTLESELKKLLENKNKAKDIKLDKISFLSKNIQSIGNQIPLLFCNITRLYLSNNNLMTLEGIDQFANLTHLSISYNLIEDIYELNRIINPEILLFLNVKGNFFCKNPSYVEVILNLFLNLKSLDDLKINNNHKKQIKYGQDLSRLILPFLLDIHEKIERISTLQNVCKLNNEYNLINSSNNSLQDNNNEKLNNLLDELSILNENSLSQILTLINEKKILNNNNILSINELNNLITNYLNNTTDNNLITSENNKMKSIYETLFTSLILNQKRKDYRGFLNYLIMTSDQKLLEFIRNKGNSLKYLEMNKTSFNIVCQNFEKILMNNSNYTMENINEIQMMIFYMYFNGNNIITNDENDIEIVIDEKNKNEKIILKNYEKKVVNFREIIPEYFPIFPLDNEFMKSLIILIKEKINSLFNCFNDIKNNQLNENNKNMQNINDNNNDNNINDNNINDNNIDQYIGNKQNMENSNDINSYINNNQNNENNNDNINNNIINNYNENIMIESNNINTNLNNKTNNNQEKTYVLEDENEDDNEQIQNDDNNNNNNYVLNKPFIYNSKNEYTNKDTFNDNYKFNTNINKKKSNPNKQTKNNNIYIQENQDNEDNNYTKSFPNFNPPQLQNYSNMNEPSEDIHKPNKDTQLFNNTVPTLEPNMAQIQMKYNIIQCSKILNNIIYNNLYKIKYFFFDNLKNIQYVSKIGQIFFTTQTSVYRLQLKNFFKKLKDIKYNGYNQRNNLANKYFNYPSNKYHYKLKYGKEDINDENIMNQKALFFYYHNLKKKIFRVFKFNFFCFNKNANLYFFNKNISGGSGNEENDKNDENNNLKKYLNNDNLLNSNVYKFFHGNENEEDTNNNKSQKIENYNNSIELKNDDNNDSKNYIIKDKNYNNALELRKILEEKDEDINDNDIKDINIENKKGNNIKGPKNEVDELLNNLNKIYKELNDKTSNSHKLKKSGNYSSNNYNNRDIKNKEYINRLRQIREKERDKARKKCIKNRKLDENKLLGCPNFLKNTYSSMSKNI